MFIRNKLFDFNILKSKSTSTPTICVGNLSVGGTGKTPHIEYLIRLLQSEFNIATLSRGYGRKTKGFILAENHGPDLIGDEPAQFQHKFKNIKVSVCEDRHNGVSSLIKIDPSLDCVLLDDAFQHRKLNCGLNILITDYSKPIFKDFPLPSGRLREFRSGRKRADAVIVSKCPDDIDEKKMLSYKRKLTTKNNLPVFFSKIVYQNPISLFDVKDPITSLIELSSVLLVTGIANPRPLEKKMEGLGIKHGHVKFPDHHEFKDDEINMIKDFYGDGKMFDIILTTEKDAMRLKQHENKLNQLPIYYLPIGIAFVKQEEEFNNMIFKYVRENTRNR